MLEFSLAKVDSQTFSFLTYLNKISLEKYEQTNKF